MKATGAGTLGQVQNVIEHIRKKHSISKEETETKVESKYIKKIISTKFRVFKLIIPLRKTMYCHPRKLNS